MSRNSQENIENFNKPYLSPTKGEDHQPLSALNLLGLLRRGKLENEIKFNLILFSNQNSNFKSRFVKQLKTC